MLCRLQTLPEHEVTGSVEIGNRPVEATGTTQCIRTICRYQPVADAMVGIGAEAVLLVRNGQRAPAPVAYGRQGTQYRSFRQITQDVPAALTPGILEIKQLAAVLALE